MLAIDQSFLELILHPKGRPPKDPNTGKPIEHLPERIDELIEAWQADRETVIIPTPALAQFLILAHYEAADYLGKISVSPYFKVESFDERAAVELAAIHIGVMTTSGGKRKKKRGDSDATWAKVNFDRQIVAIAKVNKATIIYTDDGDMTKFAKRMGIEVISSWDLPTPQETQAVLFDGAPEARAVSSEDV